MRIRVLVLDDVPTILEMGGNEASFHVSKNAPSFWSRDQLVNWIGSGQDVLLGAEIDGKLVGFILTTLHRATGKATWENHFVLPECRRQGIGAALIDEMRIRLRVERMTFLHFLVKTDNQESLHYHEKMDFERGCDCVYFMERL